MKRLLLLLTTAISMFNCSDNQDVAMPDSGSKLVVSISSAQSTTDSSSSRVSASDSSSNGYIFQWDEGDKLGGWCSECSGCTTFHEFSMTKWGADNSSFNGDIPGVENSDNIRFVYPYIATTEVSASSFSIDLSAQNSSGDLSNLGSSTYMISNSLSYDEVTSQSIAMRHVGAVVDLRIKTPEVVDYTLQRIVISGADGLELPVAATLDLTKEIDEICSTQQSGSITIEATAIKGADGIYSLSFNTLPFDIEENQSLVVTATFLDSNGVVTYEGSKTITADAKRSFKRATRNGINVALAELSAEVTEKIVATIDYNDISDSSYASNSFTSDGLKFNYYESRHNGEKIQMSTSKPSSIYNTEPIKGLSKIVVTFNKEKEDLTDEFKFTSGSESEPKTHDNYIKNENGNCEITYEIPTGNEYFKIEAYSGAIIYVDKIEIYAIQ